MPFDFRFFFFFFWWLVCWCTLRINSNAVQPALSTAKCRTKQKRKKRSVAPIQRTLHSTRSKKKKNTILHKYAQKITIDNKTQNQQKKKKKRKETATKLVFGKVKKKKSLLRAERRKEEKRQAENDGALRKNPAFIALSFFFHFFPYRQYSTKR